jgi:KUP system potassium uptake protein
MDTQHTVVKTNPDHSKAGLAALTLGAIGVVYGDIGTSPLYTVKEIFAPHTGVALNPENLIGAISVIFWALMLVVTLKYVILILRADNHGEGGGLALTALASEAVKKNPQLRTILLLVGVFGATLFYGDSVITPAISVHHSTFAGDSSRFVCGSAFWYFICRQVLRSHYCGVVCHFGTDRIG